MVKPFYSHANRLGSRPTVIATMFGLILTGVMANGNNTLAQPPAAAAAPQYRSLPYGPEAGKVEKRKAKDEILKGAAPFGSVVKEYYTSYLLPGMTDLNKLELNNDARKEIVQDIANAEKAGDAVYVAYSDLLVELGKGLSTGPFHPSAGINGVHILARLNKAKPKTGAAPEPHPKATAALLDLVTKGSNDGIQAAALYGLERHIELAAGGWSDEIRARFAQPLIALLKQPRPAKRSLRADAWLKGRVMEILTKFKHGSEADLNAVALSFLADPTNDPILVEKSLTVVGNYAQAAANHKPELVKESLLHTAKFAKAKILDWQKGVKDGDEAAVFGSVGGSAVGSEPMERSMPAESGSEDGGEGTPGGKKDKKEKKVSPYASQSSDIKFKRRSLHEPLELIRVGFCGSRYGQVPDPAKSGLAMLVSDAEQVQVLRDLMVGLRDLQEALNKASIIDRLTLDAETAPKIEKVVKDIDDFLLTLGFEVAPPVDPNAPPPGDGTDAIAN